MKTLIILSNFVIGIISTVIGSFWLFIFLSALGVPTDYGLPPLKFADMLLQLILSSLVAIVGILLLIGSIGLYKNKKWGGIMLIIFNIGTIIITLVTSFIFALGGGFGLVHALLLAIVCFAAVNMFYLKHHWKELI